MKKTTCITLATLLVACSQTLANFSGGDNFNDNSMDTGKWTVHHQDAGVGLQETNGRLELLSPTTGSDRSSAWEWAGSSITYTQDWSITYDTVNLLDETSITDNEVYFGMLVMFSSFDNSFGIDRNKGNEPGDTYHTIVADASSGGVTDYIEHRNATSNEITLSIAFDSLAKTLHCSYDEGDGFIPYTNLNVSSWGMADTDEFTLLLFGGNSGMVVAGGQVFGDNLATVPNTGFLGSDDDGDGMVFLAELIAGTDPTNSASLFAITQPVPSPSGFVLNWTAVEGRNYSVNWTDSLTNSFQTLETDITYPQNSYTDTVHVAEGGGFYNLNVQLEN